MDPTSKCLTQSSKKIKSVAAVDVEMEQLRERILAGFPNDKTNLEPTLRQYWSLRERLAIDVDDGMIVIESRVVISKGLRVGVINDLQMHQGASKLR